MPKKLSSLKSPAEQSTPHQSTQSSRTADGSLPANCDRGTPPLCACGCGNPTLWSERLKRWNTNLHCHNMVQMRSMVDQAKRSAAVSKAARFRMLTANPMKDPEVAARVSAKAKGRPINRTPEGTKAIADAARKRMLSAANPMRDRAVHQAALAKTMSRQEPSKNELHFMRWLEQNRLRLDFTGLGTLWVGRRNPDFRVPGQKKVVEVTQRECFTNKRKPRSIEEYGTEAAQHYLSKGWQVLVVWKKDHRCLIPAELAQVIESFASPASHWTGAWHFDRLLRFDGFQGRFVSTT